jgi:hypothetical protein
VDLGKIICTKCQENYIEVVNDKLYVYYSNIDPNCQLEECIGGPFHKYNSVSCVKKETFLVNSAFVQNCKLYKLLEENRYCCYICEFTLTGAFDEDGCMKDCVSMSY